MTLAVAVTVFPDGSMNLDEVAYEAQANALRDGRVTLSREDTLPSFRPYLSGVSGDRVVFKYQPLWPALLALSDATTHSTIAIQLLLSAAGVAGCAWFVFELLRSVPRALIAAALFAVSPFVWVQSATILGYHLSLVLILGGSAALLRTVRTGDRRHALLAGALLGAAMLHRPFDALIAVIPLLVFVLLTERAALRRVAHWVLMGAIPFAVVLLAYDTVATGAPWRLPFNTAGGMDTFGFGERASFVVPGVPALTGSDFTLGDGIGALGNSLAALPAYVVAFPAVAGFALWTLVRRRVDPRALLLVGMAASAAAAYVFWWGSANLVFFGLHRTVGPVYHYALLVPLVTLAAWGVDLVWEDHRRVVYAAGAVGLAVALPGNAAALQRANQSGQERTDEVAGFDAPGREVVLVPGQFSGDPYVRWANDATFTGDSVVALDVDGQRLDLAHRFADRGVLVLRDLREVGDLLGPVHRSAVPLTTITGPTLHLAVRPGAQPRGPMHAELHTSSVIVGTDAPEGSWVLAPEDLPDQGSARIGVVLVELGKTSTGLEESNRYECWLEARRGGDGVEATTVCDYVHHYVLDDGTTVDVAEDLSGILDLSLEPR